ncbi:MAG: glycosyltransferase, partial [Oscillospiraceae bacterium]|nr:glycosyltransferase [Oscillospiraceae bacterium]
MKILHVNYYDQRGGAAVAAYRLHSELIRQGVDSQMLVMSGSCSDKTITSSNGLNLLLNKFSRKIAFELLKLQKSDNHIPHSLNVVSGNILKKIDEIKPDIVHLHWINGEMLSIAQIGTLCSRYPVIWTFHDAWPVCGAEHHSKIDGNNRFMHGYHKENREVKGLDIDRYIWNIKLKHWESKRFNVIAPSHWLASCVTCSKIFKNSNVEVIHNGLDIASFSPRDTIDARKHLNLPVDRKLIAFGASYLEDKNKGGELLRSCLDDICQLSDYDCPELVTIGNGHFTHEKMKVHNLGHMADEGLLAAFYSSADVFVLASRQDNLPNMIMEAMACGTPCVAFKTG